MHFFSSLDSDDYVTFTKAKQVVKQPSEQGNSAATKLPSTTIPGRVLYYSM